MKPCRPVQLSASLRRPNRKHTCHHTYFQSSATKRCLRNALKTSRKKTFRTSIENYSRNFQRFQQNNFIGESFLCLTNASARDMIFSDMNFSTASDGVSLQNTTCSSSIPLQLFLSKMRRETVEDEVDDLLPDRVVAAREVVSRILVLR